MCYAFKIVTYRKVYKSYFILLYKMKKKLSVTVEERSVDLMENMLGDGRFRNRSHIIEFALNKLIEENQNE